MSVPASMAQGDAGRSPAADLSAFPTSRAPVGLYIHVPFCVRKCRYCDFASRPFSARELERYLDALKREIAQRPDGVVPSTVYIGGGTPTALPEADLERLLALVREAVGSARVEEWTCEANPGTLTAAKARALRAAGVNRLSLGAQTFDADQLLRLGRTHTAEAIGEAVACARAAGFDNIGLDLLYALPGQSPSEAERDLERALALLPEHLSLYALTIEDGTPFAAERDAGRLAAADDETARAQYDRARALLAGAGYIHYEISNFARPGFEGRHNSLYWSGGEYLGFGPSAHSHWRGARRGNFQGLEEWAAALSKGWKPIAFEERLDPAARARETLVFGLRRIAGWQREDFRRATGFDYDELRGPEIEDLERDGLLERGPEGLRLTEGALFVSDAVFRELI